MDAGNRVKRPPNPRANANIFKILTFRWAIVILTIHGLKTEKKLMMLLCKI